jgi:hypothetical protein
MRYVRDRFYDGARAGFPAPSGSRLFKYERVSLKSLTG